MIHGEGDDKEPKNRVDIILYRASGVSFGFDPVDGGTENALQDIEHEEGNAEFLERVSIGLSRVR